MKKIRIGWVLIIGLAWLVSAAPVSGATSTSAVPRAGDWEGTGPHGLPLSFNLVRRGGRLVATSIAVGYPASCPALPRDAEAVPLNNPAYGGPGGAAPSSPMAAPAVLSGQLPRGGQKVFLGGSFSTSQSGTFSVQINQAVVGCGWPDKALTWQVHPARRGQVSDGTWTGTLTASGLINGNVRLLVAAQGRVVASFTSFFTCLTTTQQGNTTFRAVPAYEFIRRDRSFYSPLNGGLVKGHPTAWSGRFSAAGRLTGKLTIFDDCTNRLIRADFTGTRTRPAK